jgi:hypothetical protein
MNGWNLESNDKVNHDGPHDVTMKALNSTMLRVSEWQNVLVFALCWRVASGVDLQSLS